MTILDKYFIRQLSLIGLFAVLIFTICWIAPEIMLKAIQGIFQHQLSLPQGLAYILYQTPPVLVYCLPISALFCSVFFFRQLSLSTELVAMLSSGISFQRLLVPVGVVGLGISLLFFLTQEQLVPIAARQLRELTNKTGFGIQHALDPQITFVEKAPNGQVQKFLLINLNAGKTAQTQDQDQFVILFYEGTGDNTRIRRIVTAKRGFWSQPRRAWELENGIQYGIDEDGIYKEVHPYEQAEVQTSSVAHELLSFPSTNPQEFNIQQLGQYVRLLERSGQTENAEFYRVRLAQRYLLVWAPFLFALFGAGIGVERSRARRNLGLTYAAGLLLFYNVMVPVTTTLGSIGVLPAFVAAFMPLILVSLGGLAILKLRKSEG